MECKVKFIATEDIEAPSVLYKYRNWSDPLHRTILSLQIVYMAAPSTFEDEKEFKNFKQYDLMTDEEIYQKYLNYSHIENTAYTEEQHQKHAHLWTKQTPFKDANYVKREQQRFFSENDERIGILSLTEYKNNLSMWNYYASKGTGFCVGFNTKILFDYIGGGGKVVYPEEGLPIIKGTDSFEIEKWIQTFNKEQKWTFEQEYRTHIFKLSGLSVKDRKIKLPKDCISEVIIGWDMLHREAQRLIKTCKDSKLNVKYFQAVRGTNPVKIIPYLGD